MRPDSLEQLKLLWDQRDPKIWFANANHYLEFGKQALGFGHPSLAFDILSEGLKHFEREPYLVYWAALALARGGSTNLASDFLNPLVKTLTPEDDVYADAMSLAGRLAKDRWAKVSESSKRNTFARASADFYKQAYAVENDFFPGINAATMTLLSGDAKQARELAQQVKDRCVSLFDKNSEDYWLTATLGEACLILEQQVEAVDWYQKATQLAGDRFGEIASMRRQVKYLSEFIDVNESILQILEIPRVVAFSGHMIDAPGRQEPRFAPEMENAVREKIDDALERLGANFGYCSAACGADIIFIEAMLNRNAEVHVLLPFEREDFINVSVAFAGSDWVTRFENALDKASEVQYATEEAYLQDDVLFSYTNNLISGAALLRAEQLETDPVFLAVVDKTCKPELGGALELLHQWESTQHVTEAVELSEIKKKLEIGTKPGANDVEASDNSITDRNNLDRIIKTMLFADVVGFSKLGEESAPSFFVDFLNEVADVIHTSPIKPDFCNTWGDGLFIVYDDTSAAADFASRLCDRVNSKDWGAIGLPGDTNIRIGMHTGPVFEAIDPIIDKRNFYGTHVNRAARIEPVTTPGSIYISEQAACLLASSGTSEFECDNLGRIKLAKEFGVGRLFRLRRRNEAN